MALFSRKPKTESKEAAPTQKSAVAREGAGAMPGDLAHILTRARVTEKASDVQARNVYVFNVAQDATKRDIMFAVKELYGVTPKKVAVVTVKGKIRRNMRTGRVGVKKGGKKAYVYLKQGDTITIA